MSESLLEMKNICKSFPGVKALQKVDFQLKSGEIHALLGENGAGKSTLIKVLGGIYMPEEGQIYINGQEVAITGVNAARDNGVSIIHQELVLVPHMTVAENIFLGRYNGRNTIAWKELKQKAAALLADLGFNFDVNKEVGKLSTAEKQLVEIAKALSLDAHIIVMDEPTSSLTEKEVDMFFPIIERLKEKGITVIYISHKLDEIYRLCDDVTIMRDGQVTGNAAVK